MVSQLVPVATQYLATGFCASLGLHSVPGWCHVFNLRDLLWSGGVILEEGMAASVRVAGIRAKVVCGHRLRLAHYVTTTIARLFWVGSS